MSGGEQATAEKGGVRGLFRTRSSGRESVVLRVSWRREAHSHQTFFSLFCDQAIMQLDNSTVLEEVLQSSCHVPRMTHLTRTATWRLVLNGFYNYYAVRPTSVPSTPSITSALPLAGLPGATKPAAQADVAEDDAARGALAAQPEIPAPLSRLAVRRHDPRWEPGALVPLAGICAGAASNRPSLPRLLLPNRIPGSVKSLVTLSPVFANNVSSLTRPAGRDGGVRDG